MNNKQTWYEKLAAKSGGAYSPRTVRLAVALLVVFGVLVVGTVLFVDVLRLGYSLLWNILLAALPLVFSMLLVHRSHLNKHGLLSILWAALWVFMYPNALYMVTDLIHINLYEYMPGFDLSPSGASWFGLVYIAAAAAVGCVFGCLSLYLLHNVVRRRKGSLWGWLFCAGVSVFSGIGIYIGRFMRFNSWDILQRPLEILRQLVARASFQTFSFFLLFCGMGFAVYLLFYLCFDAPEERLEDHVVSE